MKAPARLALAAAFGATLLATPASAAPPVPNVPPAANTKDDDVTQMRAQLQRTKDAVNAAKKPEDLDPVLFDLQKYENNGFGFGGAVSGDFTPEKQRLYQQLVSAAEFTKSWQSYLSHTATGQADQARNDLYSLLQNNYGSGLMPRSHLLALQAGQQAPPVAANGAAVQPVVAEAQKIIDGINTLDDMQGALEQLNSRGQEDALAREDAQHLAPMVEAYGDLKHGLPTNVSIDFMGGVTGAGVSIKVNSLLLKFILQHYFDTYKGPPPRDDETPADYAQRVKSDALAGSDLVLLKKALTVHSWMFRNVTNATPDDETAGFDDLTSGINQQAAGQYAQAVVAYLRALKSGNPQHPRQVHRRATRRHQARPPRRLRFRDGELPLTAEAGQSDHVSNSEPGAHRSRAVSRHAGVLPGSLAGAAGPESERHAWPAAAKADGTLTFPGTQTNTPSATTNAPAATTPAAATNAPPAAPK